MNNILDMTNEYNQLFIASVIAVLCESSPITLELKDIERYWSGDIKRLQYDLVANEQEQSGHITFSLREE
jgi:hypothetical protein